MKPEKIWEQLVEQLVMEASSLLRTTSAIAENEEKGLPPDRVDLDELQITADNIAIRILDLDDLLGKIN